jgi:hypothetical protein
VFGKDLTEQNLQQDERSSNLTWIVRLSNYETLDADQYITGMIDIARYKSS